MRGGDGKPVASRLWQKAVLRWSQGWRQRLGWQLRVDQHPRQHRLTVLQSCFHQLRGPVLESEVCGARGDLADAFMDDARSSKSHRQQLVRPWRLVKSRRAAGAEKATVGSGTA